MFLCLCACHVRDRVFSCLSMTCDERVAAMLTAGYHLYVHFCHWRLPPLVSFHNKGMSRRTRFLVSLFKHDMRLHGQKNVCLNEF